ncbi:MAG: PEP-CTERM sorting domain-containing protein [bacterium]|nr:PEP-CTERM sorting domain-containing protein [bacterium]
MRKTLAVIVLGSLMTASGAMAGMVSFDFTGTTTLATKTKTFTESGLTATASAAAYRMALEPTNLTSIGQTTFGLGVGSVSDWDTIGAGVGTINYSFTGPGETLFLDFDKEVRLNTVDLGGLWASGPWPQFTAVVSAIDENNTSIGMVGLNPWGAAVADWIDFDTVPIANNYGFGSMGFALGELLPTASRFAFSGIIGLDHLDTHYILGGVDVTPVDPPSAPVPLPGTLAILGFGLLGMTGITRRKKQ